MDKGTFSKNLVLFNTPILLLAFNRPKETEAVLEVLSKILPLKFYVAVDGPRKGNHKDEILVSQVKELINGINWSHSIEKLYNNENLGCGRAVNTAITWFFENVGEGIIVEDDCLLDESFFNFSEKMFSKKNSPLLSYVT